MWPGPSRCVFPRTTLCQVTPADKRPGSIYSHASTTYCGLIFNHFCVAQTVHRLKPSPGIYCSVTGRGFRKRLALRCEQKTFRPRYRCVRASIPLKGWPPLPLGRSKTLFKSQRLENLVRISKYYYETPIKLSQQPQRNL